MLSTNQINQLFLQNILMKQRHFLDVDTNSQQLKVDPKLLGGHGQKWMWSMWTWDSEFDTVSQEWTDEIN